MCSGRRQAPYRAAIDLRICTPTPPKRTCQRETNPVTVPMPRSLSYRALHASHPDRRAIHCNPIDLMGFEPIAIEKPKLQPLATSRAKITPFAPLRSYAVASMLHDPTSKSGHWFRLGQHFIDVLDQTALLIKPSEASGRFLPANSQASSVGRHGRGVSARRTVSPGRSPLQWAIIPCPRHGPALSLARARRSSTSPRRGR